MAEYPFKPLECWAKLKEVRRKLFWDYWKTKERGEARVLGGYGSFTALPIGIGARGAAFGIYYARIMRDRDLLLGCHQTMDSRGYGSEICSTLRVNLGSMFMGFHSKSPSGEYYKPDFILEFHLCDSQCKAAQVAWEYYQIPYHTVEIPLTFQEREERKEEYVVQQLEEAIRWMEKVTGRKYDDEKLLEAVPREWESRILWSRICLLNQAVPAPLDQKMLNSFQTLYMWGPHLPEVVEVMRLLYAETQERVRAGIAAFPLERARLFHEGQIPWFYPAFLRFPNRYGASFIGGTYTACLQGSFLSRPDGSWEVPQTLEERGIRLRGREDALRSLADLYLNYSAYNKSFLIEPQVKSLAKAVEAWHVDGVMFHIDRGCKGQSSSNTQARLELQRRGVPSMVYEANNADPREFSETQVLDQMEAFLESLGLTRLQAAVPVQEPED